MKLVRQAIRMKLQLLSGLGRWAKYPWLLCSTMLSPLAFARRKAFTCMKWRHLCMQHQVFWPWLANWDLKCGNQVSQACCSTSSSLFSYFGLSFWMYWCKMIKANPLKLTTWEHLRVGISVGLVWCHLYPPKKAHHEHWLKSFCNTTRSYCLQIPQFPSKATAESWANHG